MEFHHVSILMDEALKALAIRQDGVYVDATLGGAGHSSAIAQRLGADGTLLCIDRDDVALENARERLAAFADRVILEKSDFRNIGEMLKKNALSGADGILFDLGVSSPQLDTAERGFSYMKDGALDMRMDRTQSLTAYDVVNEWDEEALVKILFGYGEERYARRIAAGIVNARRTAPIATTQALVDVIKAAMPQKALREKQHQAKRSFQAIRIAVNDELAAVEQAMVQAIDCLHVGGVLAVITFHSLEDRIVKNAFAQAAQGCTCPKDFPVCVCGKTPTVKLTPRKPILPGADEIETNPRARSAKLRVCTKL